ncbi:hypothetical protein [Mucilaginibacter phyllosphaerae]|uniref:Uncharacterized protein n=1 Tax=Mucilaginibacter phyllosphaerae TaxID=1812349 RepID=A0A4Y8ABI6_9SPHI|nr:hypothetical protein [Mucilaginibacter phyllosphaerae]MBB3969918.1 hypothetical protein [Mucilaginibacter phyllosphaerae]TEW65292.1 hypothetical protein E2R65_15380 [Mucilaginibacter phyllosphaerae]GGH16804.1 hypothetical protein GCM10007352_26450 [Mucilaginibacter phyllosphaerae]
MSNFSPDQIEYLTTCIGRFKKLGQIIFNEPFLEYHPNVRFSTIKDLYSIYNEIYSANFFEENHGSDLRLIEFGEFQKELVKMIRNVLLHFPFFDNWNEVWIKRSLVTLTLTPKRDGTYSGAIEKFFLNYSEKKYAVRLTEYGGNQITTCLIIPKGYENNDKIYLKDIIEERYVGMLSVGFMRILINNFLLTNGLNSLVIPLVETVKG